jgi:hypothetical protein
MGFVLFAGAQLLDANPSLAELRQRVTMIAADQPELVPVVRIEVYDTDYQHTATGTIDAQGQFVGLEGLTS